MHRPRGAQEIDELPYPRSLQREGLDLQPDAPGPRRHDPRHALVIERLTDVLRAQILPELGRLVMEEVRLPFSVLRSVF